MHYLYKSYKIAMLDKQPFAKKYFFCMTPLHAHAHAQYICIIYAKKTKASVKALVQVDFSMYALSKQKQQEKMAKFTKLSFCQTFMFWHQTSSCKCSMCLYYVSKVSDCFSKDSGTS